MSQTQGTPNNYGQYSGGGQPPPVPSDNPQPPTGNYNPGGYPSYGYNYGPPGNYPAPQPPRPVGKGQGCLIGLVVGVVGLVVAGIIVLNLAGLALKGVGLNTSSGSGSKSQAKLDACAFLTQEEVASFLGSRAKQDDKSSGNCTYSNGTSSNEDFSTDQPIGFLQVSLDQGNHDDFILQKKLFAGLGGAVNGSFPTPYANAASSIIGNGQPQDLSGLGDEAFWNGSFLFVRKGDKILSLTAQLYFSKNKTPLFDTLKALASKAVTRM